MLKHDSEFCIGCRSCQVACQDLHHLPPGKSIIRIEEQESLTEGGIKVKYVMESCRGCKDLACVRACPMQCLSVD